jgi:tRNA threonylcarbamoyladenosine dehydratase
VTDPRFDRVVLALGKTHFRHLQGARICIIGLGAVGGFAAEGLARSGIGFLKLIDIDVVQVTNINRQICALDSTIGIPKVNATADRLTHINPSLKMELHREFFHSDTASKLLDNSLDFLIDAIDAVGPKIELLAYCHTHNIPVISCMGAALKTDLSLIQIVDISKTRTCPLSRVIRRGLHRRKIYSGIDVIYSPEQGPPVMQPEAVTDPVRGTDTHRGRPRRILGSLCTVPAVFGMMAAHHVIQSMGGTTLQE